MSVVEKAIEAGRCVVALGAAQLREAEVMLALRERASLVPLALSGPAQSPVVTISESALAKLAQPGSVLGSSRFVPGFGAEADCRLSASTF